MKTYKFDLSDKDDSPESILEIMKFLHKLYLASMEFAHYFVGIEQQKKNVFILTFNWDKDK